MTENGIRVATWLRRRDAPRWIPGASWHLHAVKRLLTGLEVREFARA